MNRLLLLLLPLPLPMFLSAFRRLHAAYTLFFSAKNGFAKEVCVVCVCVCAMRTNARAKEEQENGFDFPSLIQRSLKRLFLEKNVLHTHNCSNSEYGERTQRIRKRVHCTHTHLQLRAGYKHININIQESNRREMSVELIAGA